MTALEIYRQACAARDEAIAIIHNSARDAFGEMAQEFFKANPEVKTFSWRQYVPFYNDGDACLFSAWTDADSLYINGVQLDGGEDEYADDDYDDDEEVDEDSEDSEDSDGDVTAVTALSEPDPRPDYEKGASWDEIDAWEKRHSGPYELASALLKSFDDDTLEFLFGEHASVEVRRDGTIEVEEYLSHE